MQRLMYPGSKRTVCNFLPQHNGIGGECRAALLFATGALHGNLSDHKCRVFNADEGWKTGWFKGGLGPRVTF
jgi:hypothetical protein